MKHTILTAVLLALLAACSTSRETGAGGAIAGEWLVEEVEGTPIAQADVEEQPFLGFSAADGNLYGSLSCNTLTGTYRADSTTGRLRLGSLGSTMMLCASMTVEQRLLSALGKVSRYEAKDGALLLSDDSGKPLIRLKKK